jgi:hypothetical protein
MVTTLLKGEKDIGKSSALIDEPEIRRHRRRRQ